MTLIPAVFMAAVTVTYICLAKEGFRLPSTVSYPIGIVFALGCLIVFFFTTIRHPEKRTQQELAA
jgi:hypothetical protein